MTKKEILAVLDMSEEEQIMWCLVHTDMREPESLADLAFRKRDEVDAGRMHDAMYLVQQNVKGAPDVLDYATAFWGLYHAKPIHWILAASMIKAKESSND